MFGGAVDVLDVIAATAGAGFDALGLDLASVEAHGSVPEVAVALGDAGLRCTDVLVLVPGADEHLAATARRLGRVAEACGAPSCIAAVAAPVPWAELVASLEECGAVLADHGCRLAIEFTPYSGLTTLQGARDLCDALGWERSGVVLDALHFFRSGAPWEDLARLRGSDIAVVQWDDAPATAQHALADESRNHRLAPGEGELPLRELAAAIRATGYDGTFSAEILSASLRSTDPATAARRAFRAMAATTADSG